MPDSPLNEFPLLVTDASSAGAHAGILGRDGWLAYRTELGETSRTLFDAVQHLLQETGLQMRDFHGFVFCQGPGSTLGIRINCMAIRTWISLDAGEPPVYAYKSLEAMAKIQSDLRADPFAIFSDLRKNYWNGIRVDSPGQFSPIQVVGLDDLENWPENRFHIQQRLYSPGGPPGSQLLNYDIEPLKNPKYFSGLIQRVEKPTVFQTTATKFKKWVPQRHR